MNIMEVVKRSGESQKISFDKILNRIEQLSQIEPVLDIQPAEIAKDVISKIKNKIKTTELDELSANICSSKSTEHIDYSTLASRIIISNNHKNTLNNFGDKIKILYEQGNITEEIYDIYLKNNVRLESIINYDKDYNFDFFAFRTLEKAYLHKTKDGEIIERIQDLLLRVSLGIHKYDIDEAIKTYNLMSEKYFIHASPTLFNAGTNRPQLLSCFLLGMHDSIDGMYKCIKDCASISKWAGGIGIHIHDIRGKGSHIKGTNGKSSGIVPLLRTLNQTARHVNQGGKRLGSFAIYLEPHHPDILEFLNLKKNIGIEEERARDLFYAMWISDLFMERVENDEMWSLFCPNETPNLSNVHSDEYRNLYIKYENEGLAVKQLPAREIWFAILTSQMETGTPYLAYKDSANFKSNQKHYGTIKSSNLCIEIMEYSDDKEYACCTLASIGLPRFVEEIDYSQFKNVVIYTKDSCNYCNYTKNYLKHYNIKFETVVLNDDNKRKEFYKDLSSSVNKEINSVPQIFINDKYVGGFEDFIKVIRPKFNFTKLMEVSKVLIKNLNKIIDLNFYPVKECETSNKKHRPLGLGVQGLADVYNKMRIAFDSEEAKQLNKEIFATIYYASLEESNKIASKYGSYDSFENSPASNGLLQFDLWKKYPIQSVECINTKIEFDWCKLKDNIKKNGLYNSLLTSCMPTASTGQILGNTECIEPCTSYLYTRSTLSGTYIVLNKDLQKELLIHNVWNNNVKDKLLLAEGSIQNIPEIPIFIKKIYKNVWDLSNKHLIDQSADRGIYVCQSQSLNLFIKEPDYENLTSMHFYAWKQGLKTGIYYLRSLPQGNQKFTIDPNLKINDKSEEEECVMCSG